MNNEKIGSFIKELRKEAGNAIPERAAIKAAPTEDKVKRKGRAGLARPFF